MEWMVSRANVVPEADADLWGGFVDPRLDLEEELALASVRILEEANTSPERERRQFVSLNFAPRTKAILP